MPNLKRRKTTLVLLNLDNTFLHKAIKQHKSLTRKDVDELLWEKLPNWMSENQKRNKVGNLLSELRMDNIIENIGTTRKSNWILK